MRRKRKRCLACRRDGVASLELVMSAPILMFLIAMLYTLYIATMMKSQLTMEVRHTAWLPRTQAANGSLPFSVTQAHATGQSTKELSRRVRVYRNWYPSVPRDIRWGNVVLTGSWDHREVSFQNGFLIYPHFGVLTQMVAAQGGVPAKSGDITNLGDLTKIPGL
ncbi:MAG: TadE/TadG family type IV pilus assembly protein [Pirellulaceae bacterium]